jgi:hypothetical protein
VNGLVAFQERHCTPSFESLARELLVVGHEGISGFGDFANLGVPRKFGSPKFAQFQVSDRNGSNSKTSNLGMYGKDHNIALDK